jgi:hypothetical protein
MGVNVVVKAFVIATLTWLSCSITLAHAGPSKSTRYIEMKTELVAELPENVQQLILAKVSIDFQILSGVTSHSAVAYETNAQLAQAMQALPKESKDLVIKIYPLLIQSARYRWTPGGCTVKC